LELQPSDLDRLNSAIATSSRTETEKRRAWARWAERRAQAFLKIDQGNKTGADFKLDQALLQRSREIEGESIRVEAERPGGDPAGHWLALAARARERQVPEPEPSAMAHRGFRAALAAARTPDELKALVERIEGFFPAAKLPAVAGADLEPWERPYANDPFNAYTRAPESARKALDRRLWADAVQKAVERRAAEQPDAALTLAEEASDRLPDRPEVARALFERGLSRAEQSIGTLGLGEVESLAKVFKDRLNQPDRARALYRAWLDEQRDRRLSPHDAEGRIALAQQYEQLLDDRASALALLKDALVIDPRSRDVADAFLRRGYRKVKGEWVEPSLARASPGQQPRNDAEKGPGPRRDGGDGHDPPGATTRAELLSGSLLNASPDQVRARMGGEPVRKYRSATQGRLMEQWVYPNPRGSQYINFLLRPGDSRPRVVSHYTLPAAVAKGASQ
jgi:tetratricopeptide (TPR) repeat protein